MKPGSSHRFFAAAAALAILAPLTVAVSPAAAQFSAAYNFFKGVRDRDFAAVSGIVEQPGSTVINVRDRETGEAAIHIVTRRRDTQWLLYLLQNRANPNIGDRQGNTAMHIAAQIGFPEGIRWLNAIEANVNAANDRGETPLILAVQARNAGVVRQLVEAGADPDIADSVVGMSARDYAARDTRAGAILEILDSANSTDEPQQAVGPTFE